MTHGFGAADGEFPEAEGAEFVVVLAFVFGEPEFGSTARKRARVRNLAPPVLWSSDGPQAPSSESRRRAASTAAEFPFTS